MRDCYERVFWRLWKIKSLKEGQNEGIEVYMGKGTKNRNRVTEFKSYQNTLMANLVDVMSKFLDEFYAQEQKGSSWKKNGKFGLGHSANRKWENGGHSQGGSINGKGKSQAFRNGNGNVKKYFRCGSLVNSKLNVNGSQAKVFGVGRFDILGRIAQTKSKYNVMGVKNRI